MHKVLIPRIIKSENPEDMRCLETLMLAMIDKLYGLDHDEYLRVEHKLYKRVYGKHLNEDLAYQWVSSMKNKDGTYGEHWSIEQTSQYAGTHNKYDWYAVLNMMYSDYYNPKFDTNIYIELARDWLNDSDVEEGKTLNYYRHVVKEE